MYVHAYMCCVYMLHRYQDNDQHEEAVRDYEKMFSMEHTAGVCVWGGGGGGGGEVHACMYVYM